MTALRCQFRAAVSLLSPVNVLVFIREARLFCPLVNGRHRLYMFAALPARLTRQYRRLDWKFAKETLKQEEHELEGIVK